MNAVTESPNDCCCGHAPRLHSYGVGMCMVCRRACEKFHQPGEGHFWAPLVLVLLVVLVLAGVAFGVWQLWFTTGAGALIPF